MYLILLILLLGFTMVELRKVVGFFLTEGKRAEVPTACIIFLAEMLSWPPKSYVERIYNLNWWTEMLRGGHFAAM
jgi:hypothetical protein